MLNLQGLLCFVIYVPLCLVRRIEKFAWTHLVADVLIILTLLVIFVYALLKLSDKGWGSGIDLINTNTWLTMIGSAAYSYEGIGIILPLYEVTERKEMYSRILVYVFVTTLGLYLGFGGFCLFVWGD